jgi:zinc transport system substrate-binding protein
LSSSTAGPPWRARAGARTTARAVSRTISRTTLIAAALVLPVGGCTSPTPRPGGSRLVVVSIFPVADLVARVGGDAVRVQTLLPPRASPATWEVTPEQVRAVARADGYVTVGGGLDGWIEDLAAGTPGLRRLRLTDGLELIHDAGAHGHGEGESGNPHVWLDPILVRDELLPRISAFLQALAPEDSSGIRVRALAVEDTLTRLDGEVRHLLSAAPERGFIATHDAWVYFARRYGLRSLGSIYESPGHEPSARGLADLVDLARSSGVHAILAEPQLAETAGRALAGELHAEVIIVDPLGGPGMSGRDSYTALLRTDARAFARALGAPAGSGAP